MAVIEKELGISLTILESSANEIDAVNTSLSSRTESFTIGTWTA